MILPLAILFLILYYTAVYSLLRYAAIHTLRKRIDSLLYREAVLIAFSLITPVVIIQMVYESIKRRIS
jgi:hypothetical protein